MAKKIFLLLVVVTLFQCSLPLNFFKKDWKLKCAVEDTSKLFCSCSTLNTLKSNIDIVCSTNETSINNKTKSAQNISILRSSLESTLDSICSAINRTNCSCQEVTTFQENCLMESKDKLITGECRKVGINDSDCYCETLYRKQNMTCTERLWTIPSILFTGRLNEICDLLNITREECKCPDLKSKNQIFISLCDASVKEFKCEQNKAIESLARFAIIACFFGVAGNIFVIIVRSKQWKGSIHYKLINGLAVADLLFSLLQILYHVPTLVGCKWPYGLAMCKILHSLLGLSYSIDLGFIVIIAIERYIGIVHPLSDLLTDYRVYMLVVLNVCLSFLSVIPSFMILNIDKESGRCVEVWDGYVMSSLTYSWLLFIFYFLLPTIVTAVLYRSSMCALKRSSQRRMTAVSQSSRSRLLVENRRILLVLSSLLIALVILVSPNRIIWIVLDHIGAHNLERSTIITMKIVAIVPYTLHIIVNPVIYSLVDKKFRTNAKYLLLHFKRKNSSIYSQTGSTSIGIPLTERKKQSNAENQEMLENE